MRTDLIILLCLVLLAIGIIFLIQEFYIPTENKKYRYSPTDFVQPTDLFIKCDETSDCIKVKGSVCPPETGGIEVCVNKNYFQEYISYINERAGFETDVSCPAVNMVTNKTCGCAENKCVVI